VAAVAPRLVALAALLAPAPPAFADSLRDLYFGEALYQAYQGNYFDALERLDTEIAQHYRVDEPQRDSLHYHIRQAEFSVGDFELDYRMHLRAGRAIRAVLEGDVPEPVRNEAGFRLARLDFQEGQPDEALAVLDRIHGEVPEAVRADLEFLRANAYLATGRPTQAVAVLRRLQDAPALKGYSAYNLAIALLQDGHAAEAVQQLDRAGQLTADDRTTLAIRDKSNLLLGTLLFESSQFGPAQQSLERVRLDGPYSNQALLRAGWAEASAQKFDRAIVPWSLLIERESTDPAVQEALLALPYAYSKLNVNGRAAVLYGHAVETFTGELEKLDASIRSVEEGAFLRALAREEIRQDKDWVIRLRSLPDAPETFYLTTLIASHDFQTALQNYLDLEDMRERMVAWQRSLDAFTDLIHKRQDYYEPLLPGVDAEFRALDARMRLRLEQQKRLARRLQGLLTAPRPEHLATAEELAAAAWIAGAESKLRGRDAQTAELRARLQRLRGVIVWNQRLQYHERLTLAHQHLRELAEQVDRLTLQYDAFVRTRQAATHGYVGYEDSIATLRQRITAAQKRMDGLMDHQGRVLERVAVAELRIRRERMQSSLNQARFAFADSYDRAAKAQAQ
jgi:predicted negative regulator of RcsB-dependent stress response